jgi:hypothetical protein
VAAGVDVLIIADIEIAIAVQIALRAVFKVPLAAPPLTFVLSSEPCCIWNPSSLVDELAPFTVAQTSRLITCPTLETVALLPPPGMRRSIVRLMSWRFSRDSSIGDPGAARRERR